MKTSVKSFLVSIAVLLAVSFSANAYDFEYNGICYNILSEENCTVEVTYNQDSRYSEAVEIPPKVIYRDKTYNVTSIGRYAFHYNTIDLTSVTIPASVISIEEYAFYFCYGLTNIEIPFSVTSISSTAFLSCINLKEINVSVDNLYYSSVDGVLYNKDMTEIIYCCINDYGSFAIPNSVVTIGDHAFSGCNYYYHITIPNSVISIGDYAFKGCSNLTDITIPNSVISIGDYAFSGCSSLKRITLSNSVTSIGDYAFRDCRYLEGITIPNSVISIGKAPFYGCSRLKINVDAGNLYYSSINGVLYNKDITELIRWTGKDMDLFEIPSSVTYIAEFAFQHCGCKSVTIPSSITSIGNSAFENCGFMSVSIPNSVTSIGENAFSNCSDLKSIEISNSVTSIGDNAFSNCSYLKSIEIPNSVIYIGKEAFSNCQRLEKVIIPSSVTSIGKYAFIDCGYWAISILSIFSIYCKGDVPPEYNNDGLGNRVLESGVLYVPVGAKSEYEKVDPWRNFRNIQEMDYSGIESIEKDDDSVVAVDGGAITVGSDMPVEVYSMSGQCVYRGCDRRIENLAPGIYVVRAGGKSVKAVISR